MTPSQIKAWLHRRIDEFVDEQVAAHEEQSASDGPLDEPAMYWIGELELFLYTLPATVAEDPNA